MTSLFWVSDEASAAVVRDNAEGSRWASLVALLAVAGTLGALYLPLLIH
jgi:hypothetical protein